MMKKIRGGYLIPTPVTQQGLSPTITAAYPAISTANIMDLSHFPKMGVIDVRYENSDT